MARSLRTEWDKHFGHHNDNDINAANDTDNDNDNKHNINNTTTTTTTAATTTTTTTTITITTTTNNNNNHNDSEDPGPYGTFPQDKRDAQFEWESNGESWSLLIKVATVMFDNSSYDNSY